MANERVSQLNELLASELSTNDLFLITDMSLKESKKLELSQLIIFIQASGSFNANHAYTSDSASYVPGSGVNGPVISASYADWSHSGSHALAADSVVSASYALRATSASWAPGTSIPNTSSYALRSGYADYTGIAYFLFYNGQPNGTASWANTSSFSLHTINSDTSSYNLSSSFAKRTGMVFDSTYFTESNLSIYQPSGFHAVLRTYLPWSPDYYPMTFHRYILRSYITSGMTKYYSDPVYCTVDDAIPSSGWSVDVSWNPASGVDGYYLEMTSSNYSGIVHVDEDSFTGSIDISSPTTTFFDEGSGSWNNVQVSFPSIGSTDANQYVTFNTNAFPSFTSPVKAFAEVTWSNNILLPKLVVQSNIASITYLGHFAGGAHAPTYTPAYTCSNFGIMFTTPLASANYCVIGNVNQPYNFTERGLVAWSSKYSAATLTGFTMSMVTYFDNDYWTNVETGAYTATKVTHMVFMVLGA